MGSGQSSFAVNLIVKTAKDNFQEAKKLAEYLKGRDLAQTLTNIQQFVFNNFQYQGEGLEHSLQTLSRAYHEFRDSGINCEDSTLIILQLLSNLGIRSYVRRIHQAQSPNAATHVYVIVPKDQKTAKISGRDSYFVLDGTLPSFDLEAPYVKKIDTMAEPQVKYSVMNGVNCAAPAQPQVEILGPDPEKQNFIIILVKPTNEKYSVAATSKNLEQLKAMNCPGINSAGLNEGEGGGTDVEFWAKLGATVADLASKINWGAGEKKRAEDLLKKIKADNSLLLYPRPEHGGPWRANLGAGKITEMTPDELRYFIEWRIPVYKKGLDGRDWGNTKQRVKDRYNHVADLLKAHAIDEFKKKVGCYTHSGVYDGLVAKHPKGSDNIALSASNTVRPYQENCKANDGGLINPTTGKNDGTGANTASFSTGKILGVLTFLGFAGGAYKMYQNSQKAKKTA
tara:strand:+ start:12617 stop:13975 length:1359 start_codon:yes stop_codon:yes gene_type:complete